MKNKIILLKVIAARRFLFVAAETGCGKINLGVIPNEARSLRPDFCVGVRNPE
jgi:hypothetical protein